MARVFQTLLVVSKTMFFIAVLSNGFKKLRISWWFYAKRTSRSGFPMGAGVGGASGQLGTPSESASVVLVFQTLFVVSKTLPFIAVLPNNFRKLRVLSWFYEKRASRSGFPMGPSIPALLAS